MKLSQFKFKLPDELIAQYPSTYPEDARMLVLHRKTGKIEHRTVQNVVDYFDEGDVFVFNDSKVFPARLYGKKEKTLANIEIFLLRELNPETRYWDVLVDPARKIRIGNKIFFDGDPTIVAEVVDNTTSRGRTVRFLSDYTHDELTRKLYELGTTPLPKYIYRPMDEKTQEAYDDAFRGQPVEEMDHERYQSIFAKHIGAVAAPAASLHFSKQLLKRLEIAGVDAMTLTSHIGLGNFKLVDVEDLMKHKEESEQIYISKALAERVNKAHAERKKICVAGTEIMRAVEHVAGTDGNDTVNLKEYSGWTNKFIYPPYNFMVANAFFVNFYMPLSSQLLQVASFGGFENVMAAYKEAIKQKYHFGDYGDAMLIVD